MLGTFALAMAFAGNDLVNFIGVPLAGFSAYTDFMANGNGEPMGYLMNSLNGPAKTPFLFLFLAGVIMVYAPGSYTQLQTKKINLTIIIACSTYAEPSKDNQHQINADSHPVH